jgi:hypothetical protein
MTVLALVRSAEFMTGRAEVAPYSRGLATAARGVSAAGALGLVGQTGSGLFGFRPTVRAVELEKRN